MKIKILGKTFTVQDKEGPVEPGTRFAGFVDHEKQTITIKKMLLADEFGITLLHEILHGIGEGMGAELTEKQTTGIARGLWAVMKDNDEFLAQMTKIVSEARTNDDPVRVGSCGVT